MNFADGLDRLLVPFRLDAQVPVRARNTYALVDGEHVQGRQAKLLVYRDCQLIGSGGDASAVITSLLTSLNRAVVDECDLFAAHAGVVASGETAIALPAESGDGKSTLTGACLRAGFGYGSDEAICVNLENGTVVPYPKPLGLSAWSRTVLDIDDATLAFPAGSSEGYVTAADLGADIAKGPLRLEHVVISEYGHGAPELVEIAGSEAMRVLLEMSFNHYKFGAQAFQLAARLANQSTAWRLTYDDPLQAGRLLWDRFGRSGFL